MPSENQDKEQIASVWLARRDRGFTAAEQDEFLQWLRDNLEHAPILGRLDKTWKLLDSMSEWRPINGSRPNRDLLAAPPARKRWPRTLIYSLCGMAAAVLVVVFVAQSWNGGSSHVAASGVVREVATDEPSRMTLDDGSIVDLNRGAKVTIAYTQSERHVQLLHGEAFFTVAKNPARPFVVQAGAVAVRAVGTAFNVELAPEEVSVLVTEGKVRVDQPAATNVAGEREVCVITAGQTAVIQTHGPALKPLLAEVASAQIERALAWQGLRLQFTEAPLAQVVAEFNTYNKTQLIIGDPAAGAIRLAGNFRADNVEALVRLLEKSFGIDAERRADGTTVLTLRH